MQLLGITGAIGHGKTTLAKAFLRQVPNTQFAESYVLIGEVVNRMNQHYATIRPNVGNQAAVNAWLAKLPDILREVTHFQGQINPVVLPNPDLPEANTDFDKLNEYLSLAEQNHSLVTQPVTADSKETFRPFLQWIGSYVTKHISPTLWFDELVRQSKIAEDQDCQLFIIGGVRYPSDAEVIHNAGGKVIAIERPDVARWDATDQTEAFQSLVSTDSTVINDGLIGALDHIALDIWQDIYLDGLKPRYQASRSGLGATNAPKTQNRELL